MKRYKDFMRNTAFSCLTVMLLAACGGKGDDGNVLFEQGLDEMIAGNIPVAYQKFHRAMVAFEEQGDSVGLFGSKVYIGLLCSTIGQNDEGQRLIESTPYFHVKRPRNFSSQYYWRMKAYYAFTLDSNYHAAVEYIGNLLSLDSIDYPENKAYLYMDKANLAEVLLMTGQTDKAWNIIRSLEAKPLDNDMYLSQTYYIHALLLEKEGLADSACMYARRSMKYSSKYDAPDNEANAMKIIMKRDSARGDIAAYIRQRNAYDSLSNRIRGAEVLRHIAVIQERHKYDLALMEAQKEHQERDILLLGLALCIAALCVIVFLLYKQSKLKLKTETAERCRLDKDIEYKRLENELLTLKMEQMKDELTRQRNDNENVLKQVAVSDGRKDAKTRIDMLKATLNTEHAPFLRYIEKRFPQLTHNDVLILGFIRMDMTSREAASALGISVESYYKACYRLRKKMQIDAVDGLVDFVKNVETGQV